jgi:hypothetical protein
MTESNRKRTYSTMLGGNEDNNKPPGADDNSNQVLTTDGPEPALMEPALSPANNDLMVHDHIATTTANEPQDGEAKDEEAKGADHVDIEDDSAASVADAGNTAVAECEGDKSGEEGEETSAAGDDESSASASEESEDQDMEADEEEADEEEEEEEEVDPNEVTTYLTAFPALDHAAAATGRSS